MADRTGLKSLFHIGIWVTPAELDRVLAFYKDLLDFEPVTRNPRKSGGERVFLRNQDRQFIEILVADNAQHLTHFPSHPIERVVGLPHLCFEVPSLDAARATAEDLGAEIILQAPAEGFGESEAGVHRILFVKAPGGTTLELFEFKEKGEVFES